MNDSAGTREARLQAVRLRMTAISVVNYALEAGVIALYASAGRAPLWVALLFVAVAGGIGCAFWLSIRTGWSARFADPALTRLQFACSWGVQLAFVPLAPDVAHVFLTCLMVGFNHALIVFRRQWFLPAIATLALGMAAAIGAAAMFGQSATWLESLALWTLFALSMLRLTVIGTEFTALREKLTQRNQTLATTVARLQALSAHERLAERERIARELHDDLLQGVQGLMLRLQSLTEQIPDQVTARSDIELKLHQLNSLLSESRDKVLLLRNVNLQRPPLCEALAIAGEDLAEGWGAKFRMREHGDTRTLAEPVAGEVYRIGREALLNAVQHSRCAAIDVDVTFAEDRLLVQVKDDGIGFVAPTAAPEPARDASGIAGMRQRAARLGAELSLLTAPGEGTLLTLEVPAVVAYGVE